MLTKRIILCAGYLFAQITFALTENNVLVVYNSENADSTAVHSYYTSIRTNVHSFDLNDVTIAQGNISYVDFISKIRNPIRTYLEDNTLKSTIEVIVLTKGLPHRIQSLDTLNPDIGDNAFNSHYSNGNATHASVDSELTLLQFDLENNEAGGSYDSFADNAVINPYFDQSASFSSYNRSNIDAAYNTMIRFSGYGWWRLYESQGRPSYLNAGNIYLTARLDADTVDDVKAMIDRAQSISFRKDVDALLFDSDGRTGTTPYAEDSPLQLYFAPLNTSQYINDYAAASSNFATNWLQSQWNDDSNFLIGNTPTISLSQKTIITGPVAHLNSHGANHSNGGNKTDYLSTYEGQLVNGASFTAYESYGAKALGGLTNSQGQVAEWISAGGTFATGTVWEPYTFSMSRSEIFLDRFLNQGFTYVEAAWCSIMQLSWQNVVIGDPLATATVTTADPYTKWSFDQTGRTADIDETIASTNDYDSDGNSNAIEYIFGLDPTFSDIDSERIMEFQLLESAQSLLFSLDATNAETVTIIVQSSTTLAPNSWGTIATRSPATGWSGSASVVETPSGNLVDIELTAPTANTGKRFYRLSTTITEN